jgi:hypothetical protein
MRLLSLIVLSSLLTACFTPPIKPPEKPPLTPTQPEPITAVYKQTDWVALPNWPGEQLTNTWPSWLNSCKRFESSCMERNLCRCRDAWPTRCCLFQAFFERHFEPWQITTNTGVRYRLGDGLLRATVSQR